MSLLEGVPKEEKKKADEKKPLSYGLKVECQSPKRAITAGSTAVYEIEVTNTGTVADKVAYKLNLIYGVEAEESPEWDVKLTLTEDEKETYRKKTAKAVEEFEELETLLTSPTPSPTDTVELEPSEKKKFHLEVTAPRGAKYGNRVDAVFTVSSYGDPALSDSVTITTTAKQTILAVKTGIGYEKAVADAIAMRARSRKSEVFAILSPPTLRGYLFVECMNPDALRDIVKGVHKARGVVEGETFLKDIEHFLVQKPLTETIAEGDIVELVAGPFKGEKARVQRVDPTKEEITVELFESMVPIPITVRSDHVKVVEKA